MYCVHFNKHQCKEMDKKMMFGIYIKRGMADAGGKTNLFL